MEFGERRWNHDRVKQCKLGGNTLHISASFPMSRVMSCLKCIIWSNSSPVPSYIVNFDTESSGRLVVDDMGVEWHGEHVIQSPTKGIG